MSFKLGFNLQLKVFDELPHYCYECKICLKVHNNERDYLSH
ncbi:unnamed protein product, partial [Arabidopsis halleri]